MSWSYHTQRAVWNLADLSKYFSPNLCRPVIKNVLYWVTFLNNCVTKLSPSQSKEMLLTWHKCPTRMMRSAQVSKGMMRWHKCPTGMMRLAQCPKGMMRWHKCSTGMMRLAQVSKGNDEMAQVWSKSKVKYKVNMIFIAPLRREAQRCLTTGLALIGLQEHVCF